MQQEPDKPQDSPKPPASGPVAFPAGRFWSVVLFPLVASTLFSALGTSTLLSESNKVNFGYSAMFSCIVLGPCCGIAATAILVEHLRTRRDVQLVEAVIYGMLLIVTTTAIAFAGCACVIIPQLK